VNSEKEHSRRIALTCGDPAGIGPEVIAGWLAANPAQAAGVAAIGPSRWLETLPPGVTCVPVGLSEYAPVPGKPDGESSLVAWAAMERAARGCVEGEYSAVVTGPVSKAELADIGFGFPGQTEFFAARWGGDPTMAFCGGRLRVVLATWHVALADVPALITSSVLERTVNAASRLAKAHGVVAPRIGVCGLNPHAGEGGLMGRDEVDRIDPALDRIRERHPGLSRCQPGDTVFARALSGEFDVVMALYHDQGLAPVKTLEFDESVNVTLGLPYVRTSPDHGTAFSIAGRGVARTTSFANAVKVAGLLAGC
jgi:4-hydroxythreonine-4-phosphate dehydrogenase